MKKLLAFLMTAGMLFVSISPAYADMAHVASAKENSYTIKFQVKEDEVIPLETTEKHPGERLVSLDNGVEIGIRKRVEASSTTTIVDLRETSSLNDAQKLSLADRVLRECGYGEEELQIISNEDRLKMIEGEELAVVAAYATDEGETSNSVNTWRSTLSYTRVTWNQYYFSNVCVGFGANFAWVPSIAVQGFALDPDTFLLAYAYDYSTDGVNYNKKASGFYDQFDPGFDSSSENSGGTCFAYTVEFPHTYIDITDSTVKISCTGYNSNVIVPGTEPGSTGGSFNIFGNAALVNGNALNITVSYPWGVSASSGNYIINCKTTLMATLYR